ncbi:AAA family ATPase, partial [Listeria monocytogenes]|nr:AAA family ATPase [Listeria monocytogenes]
AGKSNLLKALAIVLGSTSKKMSIHDFNKDIKLEKLKGGPPRITIEIHITQSTNEDLMGDDLVTVSNWLTKLEEPYEAKLQYEFFLPVTEHDNYLKKISNAGNSEDAWFIIQHDFLRLYIYKIWGGNPDNQITADSESLNRFDFQFLDAIRDVERDMYSGKSALLKDVIDFFVDYDIKSNKEITLDEQTRQINVRKEAFKVNADLLLKSINERLTKGKNEILSYTDDIGASFNNSYPSFDGALTENELYSVLNLIVEQESGMKLPIAYNGLGYNNLIFMSLLLTKMQVNSDGNYLGSNAKVFPVLAIEEPEAHLHPTMQNQFIRFLQQNIKKRKVKQVFITSHSTHITANIKLDDIICLYQEQGITKIAYPGKVFTTKDDEENIIPQENSKKYVQRFLDTTKSNMLFSEKIILVEGLAEQLLLPVLANYHGTSLEEKHIAIIDVGGRYFNHFLYLFEPNNSFSLKRKVVCITDIDPTRKKKDATGESFKKCYPYEVNADKINYEYQWNQALKMHIGADNKYIQVFSQEIGIGKTLEYQLAFENPFCTLLITPSMVNTEEIEKLMTNYHTSSFEELSQILSKTNENSRIIDGLKQSSQTWNEDMKKRALIASRYLNSVSKGANALELSSILQDNLEEKGTEKYVDFKVPKYIVEAIDWM